MHAIKTSHVFFNPLQGGDLNSFCVCQHCRQDSQIMTNLVGLHFKIRSLRILSVIVHVLQMQVKNVIKAQMLSCINKIV